MPDGSAGLSLLGLAGYLTIAYLTGRLLVGFVVASPSGLVRATSPILGGSAIAIQLWIYGAPDGASIRQPADHGPNYGEGLLDMFDVSGV